MNRYKNAAITASAAALLTAGVGVGVAPIASAHPHRWDFDRINADFACGKYVQWGRVAAEPRFRPGVAVCVWPFQKAPDGRTIAPFAPVLDERLPWGSWRADPWPLSDRIVPSDRHDNDHGHHRR